MPPKVALNKMMSGVSVSFICFVAPRGKNAKRQSDQVAHSGALMALMGSFPSLSPVPTLPPVLPGIISQINFLP